jgi:hypothetical protein
MQVANASLDRRVDNLRHLAMIGSWMVNHSGMSAPDKPVGPDDMIPWVFPDSANMMDEDRWMENYQRMERKGVVEKGDESSTDKESPGHEPSDHDG